MLRVTVQTSLPSRKGNSPFIWFVLETDASSVEELHKRLVTEGSIYGHRLSTEPLEEGRRAIVDRVPHVVGASSVALIHPCITEFEEATK